MNQIKKKKKRGKDASNAADCKLTKCYSVPKQLNPSKCDITCTKCAGKSCHVCGKLEVQQCLNSLSPTHLRFGLV